MKLTHIVFGSLLLIGAASCNKTDSAKGSGPDTVPPIATPGAPSPEPQTIKIPAAKPTPGKHGDTTVTATGLMYIDTKVGKGAEAKKGSKVSVNYTGTLEDGTAFDSNVDPSFGHVEPFPVEIGKSSVIAGWTEGLQGMKSGGKRRLIIPSELGYGPAGSPPKIPGNATLIFDIEALKID